MTSNATPIDPLAAAAQHANVTPAVLPGARLAPLKKAVIKAGRFVTERQIAFNEGVLDSIRLLRFKVDEIQQQVNGLRGAFSNGSAALETSLRSELADIQLSLSESRTQDALDRSQQRGVIDKVRALEAQLEQTRKELEAARRERDADRQGQRAQESLVALFLREARRSLPDKPDLATMAELPTGDDELYEALEDAFRGTFHDIKERLRVYLPDIEAAARSGRVIDVGTGRGEWLELLSEAGIDAYGIETNAMAVERCQQRDLKVVHADALVHLAGLPDASVAAVTGFHLAEHLEFDVLVELIDQAARVLEPGGLLLLESPNPMNLAVGAAFFYVDPTHKRPLHPRLLEFLLSARGFDGVEVRYLHGQEPIAVPHESEDVMRGLRPFVDQLNDLLFGAQDYAVLGRRVRA